MTKDELIVALERATGPSRELDAEIAENTRTFPTSMFHLLREKDAVIWGFGPYKIWRAPRYTASIDEALMLVPEGWTRGLLTWPGYENGKLVAPAKAELHNELSSGGEPKVVGYSAANSHPSGLAIALCIAALKAKP